MSLSNNDISASEITQRLSEADDINLLDVREVIEYHTFNIGGLNIPLGSLPAALEDLVWDKDDEIIVVCKAGLRSKTAQSILQQNGYSHVRNLTGGLMALQKLK